jgi:hypothetical protein
MEFHTGGPCTLIGSCHSAPNSATFYNGALVRYLTSTDSYLAKGETRPKRQSLAAVLAAGEASGRTGRDLMDRPCRCVPKCCCLSDELRQVQHQTPSRHYGQKLIAEPQHDPLVVQRCDFWQDDWFIR